MKHLILALALCLSSIQAFGREGNDGPNAMPAPPSRSYELAKVVIGSGFVPPNYPTSTTVQVLSTGQVKKIEVYGDGRTTVENVARLSSSKLQKLAANIQAMSVGEPQDSEPDQPGCFDAPTTIYFAVRLGAGQEQVARQAACKDYKKPNENSADQAVVQALNALLELSYLDNP
jgi:hypothetical protein